MYLLSLLEVAQAEPFETHRHIIHSRIEDLPQISSCLSCPGSLLTSSGALHGVSAGSALTLQSGVACQAES